MECRWSHATLCQGGLLCHRTEPGREESFNTLLLLSRMTRPTKAPN